MALAAIAIFSFALMFVTMSLDLGMFDEGILLSGTMRVMNGDIIHRDFYSIYGPAQYEVIAALFHFFGRRFIVARIYDLIVRVGVILIVYSILRYKCNRSISLIFTTICGVWLLSVGFYLYPVFPCLLLSLLGSSLVRRALTQSTVSPAIVVAGVCTGLSALFRYDVGFLLMVAHLLSIIFIICHAGPRESRVRRALLNIAAYGVGVSALFVPAAIAFLLVSPITPFVADIVDYSTKYYALMRGLPFPGFGSIANSLPSISALIVYLPIISAVLAFLEIALYRRRREDSKLSLSVDNISAYLIVFACVASMLLLKGLVRVSPIHMLLGIVPSLIVFALLIDLWSRRGPAMRGAAMAVMLVAYFPTIAQAAVFVHSAWNDDGTVAYWLALKAGFIEQVRSQSKVCDTGPASGMARLDPDYARVANYIAAYTRPDERILVALDRHDKIFANSPGLYFASGRLPGTHWHQFDPGLQTRADIQADIIHDIGANHVRWIVRDGNFNDVMEPNGSSQSSGVKLLDNYIDANFREVATSGKISIWLANRETPIALERSQDPCLATPVPQP